MTTDPITDRFRYYLSITRNEQAAADLVLAQQVAALTAVLSSADLTVAPPADQTVKVTAVKAPETVGEVTVTVNGETQVVPLRVTHERANEAPVW